MIITASAYRTCDEEYLESKQTEIMRIIHKSYKAGMMTREEYTRILLRDPKDSYDLERWYADLILILAENQYHKTLSRIQKGAIYLEREDLSELERKKGMKLYDELCKAARHYREIIQSVSSGAGSGEEKTNQGSSANHLDQTGT